MPTRQQSPVNIRDGRQKGNVSLFDLLTENEEGFKAWCFSGNKPVSAGTYRDYLNALTTYGKSLYLPSDIADSFSKNGMQLPEKVRKGVGKLIRYMETIQSPKKRILNGHKYVEYLNAFSVCQQSANPRSNNAIHDITGEEMKQWISEIPEKYHLLFQMLAYSGARVEQLLFIFKDMDSQKREKLSEVLMPDDENGLVAPVFRINVSEYGSEKQRTGYYYFPYTLKEKVLGFTGDGLSLDYFSKVLRTYSPHKNTDNDTGISVKTLREWNTNVMVKSGVPVEIAGWIKGKIPRRHAISQTAVWKTYEDLDMMAAQAYSEMQSVFLEALPLSWFDASSVDKPVLNKNRHQIGGQNKTKPERKKKVVELYKSGMDQSAIAKELGMSRNTIRNALREAGVLSGSASSNQKKD